MTLNATSAPITLLRRPQARPGQVWQEGRQPQLQPRFGSVAAAGAGAVQQRHSCGRRCQDRAVARGRGGAQPGDRRPRFQLAEEAELHRRGLGAAGPRQAEHADHAFLRAQHKEVALGVEFCVSRRSLALRCGARARLRLRGCGGGRRAANAPSAAGGRRRARRRPSERAEGKRALDTDVV
jgi:hypothetical protein